MWVNFSRNFWRYFDRDLHLACLTSAYRSTPHESTKFTPNMIVLWREVRLPGTLDMPHSSEPSTSYGEYVTGLRQQLSHIHVITRKYADIQSMNGNVTRTFTTQYCHFDHTYITRWFCLVFEWIASSGCEPQTTTTISGTNQLDNRIQMEKERDTSGSL